MTGSNSQGTVPFSLKMEVGGSHAGAGAFRELSGGRERGSGEAGLLFPHANLL